MKVLFVRHAQSENNIIQAEAHVMMSRGEITPEAAQVFLCVFSRNILENYSIDSNCRQYSPDGLPPGWTTRVSPLMVQSKFGNLLNFSLRKKRT
jgi:hypothetical protein